VKALRRRMENLKGIAAAQVTFRLEFGDDTGGGRKSHAA